MAKHSNRLIPFNFLSKGGFNIIQTKNGHKIIHIDTGYIYIIHSGPRDYHPLRRWLKSNFNIFI